MVITSMIKWLAMHLICNVLGVKQVEHQVQHQTQHRTELSYVTHVEMDSASIDGHSG
jgi:hypothetical protein